MKRRIKFRGRCAGAWRRGDHLTYAGGDVIKHWSGSISPEYDVIPETVGQFTGAYDFNGNEIYEGDICEVFVDDVMYLIVILWDEENLRLECFYLNGRKSFVKLTRSTCKNFYVVGNVHDNPEFIERARRNEY